jgi:hypothetical protein
MTQQRFWIRSKVPMVCTDLGDVVQMKFSRRSCVKALAAIALPLRLPMAVARSQPQEGQLPRFFAPTPTGVRRGKPLPVRFATTRVLFETPRGLPNAISCTDEGYWVADQGDDDRPSVVWFLDEKGNIKKTIQTKATDTSGVAFGNGKLWVCANAEDNQGIYLTGVSGRTLEHRDIPLGAPGHGGGCHGATWHDGHLWVTANREQGILKIHPDRWTVDFVIPFALPQGLTRYHGCAVLDGAMYMVSGGESNTYAEGQTNLIKYDLATGTIAEVIVFKSGSCDPHGLTVRNGTLIGCDSGDHPGWDKPYDKKGWGKRSSPTAGAVFSIQLGPAIIRD